MSLTVLWLLFWVSFLLVAPLRVDYFGGWLGWWSDWLVLGLVGLLVFYGWLWRGYYRSLSWRLWLVGAGLFSLLFVHMLLSEFVPNRVPLISFFIVLLFWPFTEWVVVTFGWRVVTVAVMLVGLWLGQWGIAQLAVQRDGGLQRLGESVLVGGRPGVATFSLKRLNLDAPQQKVVRAYGPFTHPNVLGGVLVMVVWLGFTLLPRLVSRRNIFVVLFVLLHVGILVTFSRVAYLSLFLVWLVWFWYYKIQGMMKKDSLMVWLRRVGLPLLLVVVVLLPYLTGRFLDADDRAVVERWQGGTWAVSLLHEAVVWRGYGSGTSPYLLEQYLTRHTTLFHPWQIDYVHSVPLLAVLEIGVVLAVIATAGLGWVVFRRLPEWWLLIPLLPLLLFDHYLLTQPAPLLVLTTGLVVLRHWSWERRRAGRLIASEQ